MANMLNRLLNPTPMQSQSGAMPVMPQSQMQPQQMQGGRGQNFLRDLIAGSLMAYGGGGMGPLIAQQEQKRRQQDEMEQQAQATQQQNATKQWLKSQGREDLFGLVDAGQADVALRVAMQKPEQPDLPTSVEEWMYAQQNPEFGKFLQSRRPGTNVTVNNQGQAVPNDAKLREGLDKAQSDLWTSYMKQGAVSGQLLRDLDMMDELAKQAPQGPLQGRLAQAFPGFSSAGDAFNSIRSRVAPSLRVEGSGSTSDIEYAGMLNSLPALQNAPGANAMISQVMRQKAQIDVERAQVISDYQQGKIPAEDARARVAKLDQRSIMTPEMKSVLGGNAALPQGVTEEDIQFTMKKHGISREEVLRRLGQ